MYKNAADLYNILIYICFKEHKEEKIDKKYKASNLFLKGCKQDKLCKKIDEEKGESEPEETIAEIVILIP